MAWLPAGEECLTTCLAVSSEYRRVTDRQTDGRTQTSCDSIVRDTHRFVCAVKLERIRAQYWPANAFLGVGTQFADVSERVFEKKRHSNGRPSNDAIVFHVDWRMRRQSDVISCALIACWRSNRISARPVVKRNTPWLYDGDIIGRRRQPWSISWLQRSPRRVPAPPIVSTARCAIQQRHRLLPARRIMPATRHSDRSSRCSPQRRGCGATVCCERSDRRLTPSLIIWHHFQRHLVTFNPDFKITILFDVKKLDNGTR